MADAVFSACFLNTLNRNCDIVGMANFAPIVNTRGCIFTHEKGIVLRSTYHVFDLYVNYLGDEILDCWPAHTQTMQAVDKNGTSQQVSVLDVLFTRCSQTGMRAVAAVNKHPELGQTLTLSPEGTLGSSWRIITVNGASNDSYNDIDCQQVTLQEGEWQDFSGELTISLPPHSVNVIQIR